MSHKVIQRKRSIGEQQKSPYARTVLKLLSEAHHTCLKGGHVAEELLEFSLLELKGSLEDIKLSLLLTVSSQNQ